MIGRLQNELVTANAAQTRQDNELAALKRKLAAAESQVSENCPTEACTGRVVGSDQTPNTL